MQTAEMNKKAAWLLDDWDPFLLGRGAYKSETAAVLEVLCDCDHPSELALQIRGIYQQLHELWIPLEDCMQISYKLLAVKYEAKCILS